MNMDNRFYTAGLYAGEDMPALLAVWPYRTGGKALCFVRPEQEAELLALLNAEPDEAEAEAEAEAEPRLYALHLGDDVYYFASTKDWARPVTPEMLAELRPIIPSRWSWNPARYYAHIEELIISNFPLL